MPRRAVSESAKAERRAAILAAAADAFDRLGFEQTAMDWLAERAGVAKGTLYLYFPTKEAVFLALYLRELTAWSERVQPALGRLPANDVPRLAGALADALDAQPRLAALGAILHVVLERNIDAAAAAAFRRELRGVLLRLAPLLEEKLDFLQPGDGARLLLRAHALAIGCWHAATPAPLARRVLAREEFAVFRVDFSEEFENVLVLLLEGWRTSGGGF